MMPVKHPGINLLVIEPGNEIKMSGIVGLYADYGAMP
jgi:hypothetical protein